MAAGAGSATLLKEAVEALHTSARGMPKLWSYQRHGETQGHTHGEKSMRGFAATTDLRKLRLQHDIHDSSWSCCFFRSFSSGSSLRSIANTALSRPCSGYPANWAAFSWKVLVAPFSSSTALY